MGFYSNSPEKWAGWWVVQGGSGWFRLFRGWSGAGPAGAAPGGPKNGLAAGEVGEGPGVRRGVRGESNIELTYIFIAEEWKRLFRNVEKSMCFEVYGFPLKTLPPLLL